MNYPGDEHIYITFEEQYLLMAAIGRGNLFSVDDFSNISFPETEEDINALIAALYQKGVLEWEDGKAAIAEAYKPMMRTMRDAEKCIVRMLNNGDSSLLCSYIHGSSVLTAQKSQNDFHSIRYVMQNTEDLIEELEIEDYFPEPIQNDDVAPEDEYMKCNAEKMIVDIFENEQVHSVLDLRNAEKGDLIERMIIIDKALYSVIYRQKQSGSRYYLCEKSSWREIIGSWMKTNEISKVL